MKILIIFQIFSTRYRGTWRLFKYFTQFNTFVYQDKRIYIELDDTRKVYSVKVMPSEVICLRVPLRSWMRLRTIQMSLNIVRNALEIRERHEIKKHNELESDELEQNRLINRIDKMEDTLKTIQATLKAICDKLDQN